MASSGGCDAATGAGREVCDGYGRRGSEGEINRDRVIRAKELTIALALVSRRRRWLKLDRGEKRDVDAAANGSRRWPGRALVLCLRCVLREERRARRLELLPLRRDALRPLMLAPDEADSADTAHEPAAALLVAIEWGNSRDGTPVGIAGPLVGRRAARRGRRALPRAVHVFDACRRRARLRTCAAARCRGAPMTSVRVRDMPRDRGTVVPARRRGRVGAVRGRDLH